MFYVRNDKDLLQSVFGNVITKVKASQKEDGIGGDFTTISSKKFIVLKVTIVEAKAHIDCNAGAVSLPALAEYYKKKEGFVLQFDGTTEKVTFSWRDVVDMAEDIYFFGPPQNGARRYEKLFRQKVRVEYLQQVLGPRVQTDPVIAIVNTTGG